MRLLVLFLYCLLAFETLKSFNYTDALSVVCRDICAKTPIFQHYNLDYVGFSFKNVRNAKSTGVLATLTSLRFEGGGLATFHRKAFWKAPNVVDSKGRKLLYILTVCGSRFLNLPVKEKIHTLTHELYHIAPEFNGDIRRFSGKKYQHGSSLKNFNAVVAKYADAWLAREPDREIWAFLELNQEELIRRYQKVKFTKFPRVKLIKIAREEALRLNPALAELPST